METALYVLACVAIPAGWGILTSYVFGRWDRRRRAARGTPSLPPVDYSI